MAKRAPRKKKADPKAEPYQHKQAESLLRPEIGLQAQFKQKKAAVKYQYDPALDPPRKHTARVTRISAFWASPSSRMQESCRNGERTFPGRREGPSGGQGSGRPGE